MEGREKYLLQHYYMLRPLLSSAQRTQLFTLPENLSEQELIRHYTLSPDDLGFILPQREDHNRLGFAAQLVYQRVLGRPMMAGETVPYALLTYLAAQLHLSPQVFALYAKRDTTRREHAAKIQKYLRLQSLTARNEQVLRQMLLPKALQTGSNIAVVAALLEEMRSRKIIIPSIPTVEKIAYTIQQEARHILFAELTSNLEAWQKDRLDTLLTLRDKTQTYFVWLKNFPRRPTPQNVLSALDRIAYIDGLGLLPRGSNLYDNRITRLAREGMRHTPQYIERLEEARRCGLLVAIVSELREGQPIIFVPAGRSFSCENLMVTLSFQTDEAIQSDQHLREHLIARGMLRELMARVDILVALNPLEMADMLEILRLPERGLIYDKIAIIQALGGTLRFEDRALEAIATYAQQSADGAWALHHALNCLMLDIFADGQVARNWLIDESFVARLLD